MGRLLARTGSDHLEDGIWHPSLKPTRIWQQRAFAPRTIRIGHQRLELPGFGIRIREVYWRLWVRSRHSILKHAGGRRRPKAEVATPTKPQEVTRCRLHRAFTLLCGTNSLDRVVDVAEPAKPSRPLAKDCESTTHRLIRGLRSHCLKAIGYAMILRDITVDIALSHTAHSRPRHPRMRLPLIKSVQFKLRDARFQQRGWLSFL